MKHSQSICLAGLAVGMLVWLRNNPCSPSVSPGGALCLRSPISRRVPWSASLHRQYPLSWSVVKPVKLLDLGLLSIRDSLLLFDLLAAPLMSMRQAPAYAKILLSKHLRTLFLLHILHTRCICLPDVSP